MTKPAIRIASIVTADADAVEALLDRAFGKDRFGRTAYRVREGTAAVAELSFAAFDCNGAMVGTIQCWPVALVRDDGTQVPMVMVGPVAVEPGLQRAGIGRALMGHMLAAPAAEDQPLMLIGDPEYYGRFFGFSAEHTAGWELPGPFERRRLLARGPGVPGGAGKIAARATVFA